MPGFDGTGPMGGGPKTGGGFGSCPPGTEAAAGAPLRGIGRGGLPWGGGRGRLWSGGRGTGFLGLCRGFLSVQRTMSQILSQDEKLIFANRVSVLERELAATREQLAALRKDVKGEDK